MFEGWAGELRPTVSPSGERVHLAFELRRSDLLREPAVRRFADRVNGTVHLPDRLHGVTAGDLLLVPGETTSLDAGSLPDGRAVTVDVIVRR